ncbi:flavin reductase family protein [Rappaport israeli]|uniref:flavin reductase family protein n=1 Tax=Rappaport israeli TaxID=1839807 RepID=UPI0009301C49|nr:flavin reductase family protein [Rappaport israeli]
MIDSALFKQSMSLFASGITVITWQGDNPIDGITVSAFASLSLNPPLVLFCIDRNAYAYPLMCEQSHFGVNILSDKQKDLAYQFAGANRQGLESFINRDNPHNIPTLNSTLVSLTVRVRDRITQGDHDIFIAEVQTSHLNRELKPLLYHQSQLFSLND